MSNPAMPHIVIAEDEPASRALLTRQLQKAGYEVTPCENGKIALDAIREKISCVVVADWMMPVMDGLELCRSIRGLSEMQALSFVYIILLTAHSGKEQIVAGLEAGADDYLTKPYHKEELLARLRAGERLFSLQAELLNRQIDLRKANNGLACLNEELTRLANTDMLTGLNNRRYLFERLYEAWALAERTDLPLACVMFDIDKFKSVNDTHGHAAGDHVLKKVAEVCKSCLRAYDILGRVGGEEFCVICPQSDTQGAAILAERIRTRIAGTQFVFEGVTIPIRVSLGVSERVDDHDKPDSLIAAADAMLYRAKENGRNQVWVVDAEGRAQPLAQLVDAR